MKNIKKKERKFKIKEKVIRKVGNSKLVKMGNGIERVEKAH